jgi:hypothetical protein
MILPKIVDAGHLAPCNAGAPGELPMLWFSSHPFWEPTATKMVMNDRGTFFQLTFRQQVEDIGCIRFALAADDPRLMDWKRACAVAGTPREQRRAMARVGRKKQADPAQWFGCSVPIPLSDLTLEVFIGKWRRTDPAEVANDWAHRSGTASQTIQRRV